jgi:ubiquinone/menaquinone biosynthesis C-methylase UbiE
MNPTERFSDRVENYRHYRPGYPLGVIELIRDTAQLQPDANVADIGSGTGILTRLLLEAGWNVHAVEPNEPMRQAAEADLAGFSGFHSVAAPAEATTLPEASASALTAAQAFHWFDRDRVQAEFRRILRPGGFAFLIWNERQEGPGFDRAYHANLASLGLEFEGVRDRSLDKNLSTFFLQETYREAIFPNPQKMTWEVLRGRFLSSSYVPTEEDPRHLPLLADLKRIFDEHKQQERVVFTQNTHIYYGQV